VAKPNRHSQGFAWSFWRADNGP